MQFGEALQFFWLLALPALVAFWIMAQRWRRAAMARFGRLELVDKLARSVSMRRRALRFVFFCLAVSFLILALARPRWGTKMETVFRRGVDIVVALDTSTSMLAQDMAPNRLAKAKSEIASLVNRLRGDRIGIVAFAGVAFLQCPLTLDYGAAKLFLDLVDEKLVPRPGTNLAEAIRVGMQAFEADEFKHKVLILITDGEQHEGDPLKAAEEAKKAGVRIYCLGIGKTQGEPIPDPSGGYKKDGRGKVIMSRLDVETLQRIAVLTGGKFHHATKSEIELDRVYEEVRKMESKELFSRKFARYEERFLWPLLIALAFLLLEGFFDERRRDEGEWGGRFA